MQKLTIIKIGGNIIDDEVQLSSFLKAFAGIDGAKILVHGGGKLATNMSTKLGIETQMVDGRRITDAETLKVVSMVYAGWVNKNITAQLNALGAASVGICGVDGGSIPAQKRPVVTVDYGFVGDVDASTINIPFFQLLLDGGYIPVVAPITADAAQLLNTNADTIASCLAIALSLYYSVALVYCFEKNGVLENVENPDSVIEKLDEKTYHSLRKSGGIVKGMIPKLDNSFIALDNGVQEVTIGNSAHLEQLINHQSGTRIVLA